MESRVMPSCGPREAPGPSCLAAASLLAGLLALDWSWGRQALWESRGRRARSETLRRGPWGQRLPTRNPGKEARARRQGPFPLRPRPSAPAGEEQAARKGCGRSSGCGVTRGGQRLEPTPSAVRRPNPSPVRVLGLPAPGGVTAGLKSRQGLRFFRRDRERTPRSRRQTRGSEVMQSVAGALQRWTK